MKKLIVALLVLFCSLTGTSNAQTVVVNMGAFSSLCDDVYVTLYAYDNSCNQVGVTNPILVPPSYTSGPVSYSWATSPSTSWEFHKAVIEISPSCAIDNTYTTANCPPTHIDSLVLSDGCVTSPGQNGNPDCFEYSQGQCGICPRGFTITAHFTGGYGADIGIH